MRCFARLARRLLSSHSESIFAVHTVWRYVQYVHTLKRIVKRAPRLTNWTTAQNGSRSGIGCRPLAMLREFERLEAPRLARQERSRTWGTLLLATITAPTFRTQNKSRPGQSGGLR